MNIRNIHIAGNCLKHNMLYSISVHTLHDTIFGKSEKVLLPKTASTHGDASDIKAILYQLQF